MHLSVHHRHEGPAEAKENRSLGTTLTEHFGTCHIGVGNQIQVLWNSNQCSYLQSHLSNPKKLLFKQHIKTPLMLPITLYPFLSASPSTSHPFLFPHSSPLKTSLPPMLIPIPPPPSSPVPYTNTEHISKTIQVSGPQNPAALSLMASYPPQLLIDSGLVCLAWDTCENQETSNGLLGVHLGSGDHRL